MNRSPLIVISWWSNCLALACLHALAAHTRQRPLYLVQVGKSAGQRARLRPFLPPGVQELAYPDTAPAEHSRVIAYVVAALPDAAGLWFIDHDVFWQEDGEEWLETADARLHAASSCLCLPATNSPAITQPAFWVSPARWPVGLSFDPIPFQARPEARRPDLHRFDGAMQMPVKDTLVHARDVLAAQGRPATYDPAGFPCHTHLGGLYLLAGPLLPDAWRDWMGATVMRFNDFFAACPPAWRAIEEPVLLRRLQAFTEALYV